MKTVVLPKVPDFEIQSVNHQALLGLLPSRQISNDTTNNSMTYTLNNS